MCQSYTLTQCLNLNLKAVELEILDNGITANAAIVFHHGTPGHASAWTSWLELVATQGVRAISYSRAGYGTSDRDFNRRVIDVNDDIAQVLDAKDITSFVSIGWSGGGPHALANTFEPRNKGAITLAGVGAYGVTDLDFLAGMGPENHEEFGAALHGEKVLQEWMNTNAASYKTMTGAEVRAALGGLISEPDKVVIDGDFADELAAVMRSGVAVSFDGWMDDDFVFIKDWGFKLSDISKPVFLWQGDQDLMVPHAHSYWLEKNIPGSKLTFAPGHGHYSLIVKNKKEILQQAKSLLI